MNARLANPLAALTLTLGGGRPTFAILNTLFFIISVGGFARFFFSSCTWKSLLLVAGAFLLLLPSPEVTLLWSDGSANYLWPTALLAVLLFPIRRLLSGQQFSNASMALLCVLGFICGWMHEAIGAPLAAGIFAAFLFCKQARRKQVFLFNVIVGLGVMPIVLSPAAWNRAGASNAGFLYNFGISAAGLITYCLIPMLITLATALLARPHIIRWIRTIQQHPTDVLLLGFFALSCLVALSVGHVGAGGPAYYYLTLSIMLMLLRLLKKLQSGKKLFFNNLITSLGSLAFIFGASHILKASNFAQKGLEQALQQARNGRQICVIDSQYRNQSIAAWLPCEKPNAEWYAVGGKFYNVKPFYTITNEFITDRSIYKAFGDKPTNIGQTLKIDNKLIIRLPQGIFCGSRRIKATQNEHGRDLVFLTTHSFMTQPWIIARCKGKAIRTFGRDYYQGFHYLILLPEDDEHLTLEIPAIIEKTGQPVEIRLPI